MFSVLFRSNRKCYDLLLTMKATNGFRTWSTTPESEWLSIFHVWFRFAFGEYHMRTYLLQIRLSNTNAGQFCVQPMTFHGMEVQRISPPMALAVDMVQCCSVSMCCSQYFDLEIKNFVTRFLVMILYINKFASVLNPQCELIYSKWWRWLMCWEWKFCSFYFAKRDEQKKNLFFLAKMRQIVLTFRLRVGGMTGSSHMAV